jgi:hypothetical protein
MVCLQTDRAEVLPPLSRTDHTMRNQQLSCFIIGAIASLSTASLALAQSPVNRGEWQRAQLAKRVPVTLVLAPFSDLARGTARIIRKVGSSADIVFMNDSSANAAFVAETMHTLLLMRESDGDVARVTSEVLVRQGSIPAALLRADTRSAERFLARSQSFRKDAPLRFGIPAEYTNTNVRWGIIYLPSSAMREELKRRRIHWQRNTVSRQP